VEGIWGITGTGAGTTGIIIEPGAVNIALVFYIGCFDAEKPIPTPPLPLKGRDFLVAAED